MRFSTVMETIWYKKNSKAARVLLPLAWLYGWIIKCRRHVLLKQAWQAPIPVVVVGNITVGGVGKTPLVVAIANRYTEQGMRVGIVSRGYGARNRVFPHEVHQADPASLVGDEPCLLTQLTTCPVMIAPCRVDAVKALLNKYPLDLVISDDGLQHHALGRQVEIVVVDGDRGFGNGCLLPAGPLREPLSRLETASLVVVHGHDKQYAHQMVLKPRMLRAIQSGQLLPLDVFNGQTVTAVAGIGHPKRFFHTLHQLNMVTSCEKVFPDHHPFQATDFEHLTGPIVMTEKDAVKCVSFAKDDWYSLCVEAAVDEGFWLALSDLISPRHCGATSPSLRASPPSLRASAKQSRTESC